MLKWFKKKPVEEELYKAYTETEYGKELRCQGPLDYCQRIIAEKAAIATVQGMQWKSVWFEKMKEEEKVSA